MDNLTGENELDFIKNIPAPLVARIAAFVFLFLLIWLLSNEDIGRYRAIIRV